MQLIGRRTPGGEDEGGWVMKRKTDLISGMTRLASMEKQSLQVCSTTVQAFI